MCLRETLRRNLEYAIYTELVQGGFGSGEGVLVLAPSIMILSIGMPVSTVVRAPGMFVYGRHSCGRAQLIR